jgi:hypothetical protein
MSSNFLQFNPSQINQQNDAAYAGDSTRADGAPLDSLFASELANKAFYQWSTFIAAFGQMMANKGFTVSDSVLATLVAQLTNVLTTADVRGGLVNLAYASALNLNATKSLGWQVTLTGNTTFTISGAQVGDELTLVLIQDYAGGRTITWPANFEDALQPDSTANSVSVMSFKVRVDGTVWTARPVLSSSGINNTPIGQGSPAAGTFSSLQAPTMASSDNSTNVATTAWCGLGFAVSITDCTVGNSCYIQVPSWLGGWKLQWGCVDGYPTSTINFPLTYTTLPGIVLAAVNGSCNIVTGSPTLSGLRLNTNGRPQYWLAIGR